MTTINNHKAQQLLINGDAIIIDVREHAEFKEHHLPGAINIPSTHFKVSHFEGFQDAKICLICHSGKRAQQVANQLSENGFSQLYILETQMAFIPKLGQSNGWTIDRQFRLTVGLLLAISLIAYAYFGVYALAIPALLAIGLIFTAIIDQCYLRMLIAKMPWNRNKRA